MLKPSVRILRVQMAEGPHCFPSIKPFGGKFGRWLDILVNNACTVEFGPFLESPDQSYDKHFDLSVRSLIELSKDAAKRMTKSGWGRIINIGSVFGEAAPHPNVTLYIATKFAPSRIYSWAVA